MPALVAGRVPENHRRAQNPGWVLKHWSLAKARSSVAEACRKTITLIYGHWSPKQAQGSINIREYFVNIGEYWLLFLYAYPHHLLAFPAAHWLLWLLFLVHTLIPGCCFQLHALISSFCQTIWKRNTNCQEKPLKNFLHTHNFDSGGAEGLKVIHYWNHAEKMVTRK